MARIFYMSKASRRNRGDFPAESLPLFGESVGEFRNTHPTVKPLALMEYLCRLTMTPTGGIVLDVFGGSGTTAVACKRLGRPCILVELDESSCQIAMERLKQKART